MISFDSAAAVPLLLLGVRDEFVDRPWRLPGAHWPDRPILGGLDLQGGGTWLAVHPGARRVACVLNGRGRSAPADGRRSRGELPLRAASDGREAVINFLNDPETRARFDPFHLVCADPSCVTLLTWDGRTLTTRDLVDGTHVVVNTGLAYTSPGGSAKSTRPVTATRPTTALSTSSPTVADPVDVSPKAVFFGPRFAARRPPGDAHATISAAWGDWLKLVAEAAPAVTDPRALIVRRELADGRLWGTTSVSLVALAIDAVRFDFQRVDPRRVPPVRLPWTTVLAAGPVAGLRVRDDGQTTATRL